MFALTLEVELVLLLLSKIFRISGDGLGDGAVPNDCAVLIDGMEGTVDCSPAFDGAELIDGAGGRLVDRAGGIDGNGSINGAVAIDAIDGTFERASETEDAFKPKLVGAIKREGALELPGDGAGAIDCA